MLYSWSGNEILVLGAAFFVDISYRYDNMHRYFYMLDRNRVSFNQKSLEANR